MKVVYISPVLEAYQYLGHVKDSYRMRQPVFTEGFDIDKRVPFRFTVVKTGLFEGSLYDGYRDEYFKPGSWILIDEQGVVSGIPNDEFVSKYVLYKD